MTRPSIVLQVERRVVNQLAAAYEQQVISQGSRVHLMVEGSGIQLEVTEGGHHKGSKRTLQLSCY